MLVLSRKVGESVIVDGRVVVKVLHVVGKRVRLGIEAPPGVPVHRAEVHTALKRENRTQVVPGKRTRPLAADAA